MDTPRNVKLSHAVLAPGESVHTVDEAIKLIDRNLPKERRHTPRWRRTRELLTKAARSRDPLTIEQATHHFERAMQAEEAEDPPGDDRLP